MMVTGTSVAYVGGSRGLPIPLATDTHRPRHRAPEKKAAGLDWNATKPKCGECGERSSEVLGGLCPKCRGVESKPTAKKAAPRNPVEQTPEQLDARFRASSTGPLAVDRSDSEPVATVVVFEADDDYSAPPDQLEAFFESISVPDEDDGLDDETRAFLARLTQVLQRSERTDDPVSRMMRLNVRASVDLLDLHLQLHHPETSAAAPSRAPKAAEPEPAAASRGEARQQPADGMQVFERQSRTALEEHRDEIVRRYAAGETPGAIGASYGGSATGVRNLLMRAGVTLRTKGQVQQAARRDRIQLPVDELVERYQAGETLQTIAAAYGVSHPVVARHLDEAGVERRGAPVVYTPELLEQVRQAYVDEGHSIAEIAGILGRSTKVVGTALQLADVELRPPVARQPADHSVSLKERIAALGVSTHDIKSWALDAGLVDAIKVGLPARRLVDAYAEAHGATA